jgi:aminopeptidase N
MRRARAMIAIASACLMLWTVGCSAPESDVVPPRPDVVRPWPDRPVTDLRFEVSADLRSVSGQERVAFTPDLDICELVFRAWPNKPATVRAGSAMTVSRVRVDGRVAEARDIAAGAPDGAPTGTLIEVPLAECVEAGRTVTVELDFDLVLGPDVNERIGMSPAGEVAWFATAFPLLAWERDRGWERGPAVAVSGESAVSEDFELDLEVVAPSGYQVLGTGRATGTDSRPDGTTVHRYTAPAVRDVAVTVGDLDVTQRTIDGVRVHVGLDRSVDRADATAWLDRIAESKQDLVDLLGPFPYDDLWVSVLSAQTSGIEFPGAIQFGDVDPAERRGLVTHELAHMWFYGLVGNDQGEHPWLDESFATFAQSVADGDGPVLGHGSGNGDESVLGPGSRDDAPPVGASMTYWAREFGRPSSVYYNTVYIVGGAALVEARDRAGDEEFDAALRQYLRSNSYSLAVPDDVQDAFSELPDVVAVLQDVGALP